MRCLIVDDEPIARIGMKRLVSRHNDIKIVGMAGSAEEAMEILRSSDVDLIFLDIQMPGLTGIELARRIPGNALVIFTTAYSEYAVEGFEVDAIDYLIKPIDPARFDRSLDKARNYMQMLCAASKDEQESASMVNSEYLIVKADRKFMRIRFRDILYIEGLKDYVVVHMEGRKIVTRMTIKGMEELLPSIRFIRVNKSYIANADRIDSFDSNDIYIGQTEIAIGQSYKERVMSRLLNESYNES